jgi:parallel beta-helix repeat protein
MTSTRAIQIAPPRALALAAAVLAAAGLSLALGAGQAEASHVSCGDEITADATLDSDLIDCPNNGIVIGADGITLDLNGHLIDGDGTEFAGCPKDEFCDVGVANDGHPGVVVRDGAVREFGVGVLVGGARKNRVVKISSSGHTFFGAVFGDSSRSVIRRSSLSRNIAPEGDGIGLFGSDHIRIVRNKIRRNPGPGIHVFDSNKNLIKRNALSRNGPAILIEKANRNEVQRNRVIRGGGILVAPGNRNVIARNHVSRGSLDSIAIDKGRGNRVVGNVVGRARKVGIRLGFPGFGGANNIVRGNLVRRSRGDGFVVSDKDKGSVLKRNIAQHNGDDGFDVESDSAKLTGNRAVRNGDLGIEAVVGVTDGGGNKARGNGDPRQCTHVSCR